MMRLRTAVVVPLLLTTLAACGGTQNEREREILQRQRPVEVLYNEALDASMQGSLTKAATLFEEVERQHPYSPWATKAQLMYAFTLYEDQRYDEALAALDRFIELHPSHADVSYAYYLKGLSYYEQITDIGRDQSMTQRAKRALEEVVRRFPRTDYAVDAQLKLDLVANHLAGKEMQIGRYYQEQKHYLAAINRFRRVVDRYQTTTHTAEALHRLVEAYLSIGLKQEAKQNAAVLGHNYPGSDWYSDSYALLIDAGVAPGTP